MKICHSFRKFDSVCVKWYETGDGTAKLHCWGQLYNGTVAL
jgi:hypothetical protein